MTIGQGRQLGKSNFIRYYQFLLANQGRPFRLYGSICVNGAQWYTVTCTPAVTTWLTTLLPSTMITRDSIGNDLFEQFTLHETIYTTLLLKCS
jgi:hypothetical protein